LGSLGSPGNPQDAAMLDDDLETPLYEAFDTGPQFQIGAGSLKLGGSHDALQGAGSLNLGGGDLLNELNDDIGLDLPGDDDLSLGS